MLLELLILVKTNIGLDHKFTYKLWGGTFLGYEFSNGIYISLTKHTSHNLWLEEMLILSPTIRIYKKVESRSFGIYIMFFEEGYS